MNNKRMWENRVLDSATPVFYLPDNAVVYKVVTMVDGGIRVFYIIPKED